MSDIKITEVPQAYSVSADDEFYAKIGNVFRRVQISKLAEIIGTPQKFRIVIAYDPDDGYVSSKSYSQIAASVESGDAIAPVLIPDQLSAEEYNGRLLYAENGEAIIAFIDASTADDPQVLIATVTDENFMTGVDVVKFPAGHRGLVVPAPESADSGNVLKAGPSGDASWQPESGGGPTNDVKEALLACFNGVAWADDGGQDRVDALEAALYPPASLVSISAVFTQESTPIYEGASLEILKPMLTVTALYDDQSTETITAYTLSGTLTEGTSTITVSYGGKTDTFTVTVSQGGQVPAGYTVVDYIGVSVSGGTTKESQIRLKKYADLNKLNCEFAYCHNGSGTDALPIFGRRSATGATSSLAFYSFGPYISAHSHGVDTNPKAAAASDVPHVVKYNAGAASPSTLQVDNDTPISFAWVNDNVLNLDPSLLTNPYADDVSNNLGHRNQIGYIKFFDFNGGLISHYVPVIRDEDNVIGMYDVVEQIFYTCSTASYSTIGNANCKYTTGYWS